MDFKQLEAFVAVIHLGSFSKAGERLFLTQPTISAHIRGLEQELGVQLIVRTTKEVYLSEEGKRLYPYAQQMLRMRDDAIAAMSSPRYQPLTIAASTIPAQYLLPEVLPAFRKAYPHLLVRLVDCDSAGVARMVSRGEADLGLAGTAVPLSECVYQPLTTDELVLITPDTPYYRELQAQGVTMERLLREPFVQREQGSGTRREFEQFLYQMGAQAGQLRVVAEMQDPEAIKRSVAQGLGVSVLSRRAAADFSRFGMLLILPLMQGNLQRKIYLVGKKGASTAQVQAISTFLLGHFKPLTEEGGR